MEGSFDCATDGPTGERGGLPTESAMYSLDGLKRLRRFPLNVRAVSAKIKLPKKYLQHCHILRTDKKNLSLLLLPS